MKRILSLVLLMCVCLCCVGCGEAEPLPEKPSEPVIKEPYEATYTEMGIPLAQTYFSGVIARCAWTVEMYEDCLYVGSGDYDTNSGPVNVWYYDFETETWEIDCFLPDEQVGRFYLWNDSLYAAGYDPKSSWELGTYYVKRDGDWEICESLPGGVHNFDLVQFDGKLFAGLGVAEGDAPVVVTTDEETWEPLHLYKDGKLRETHGGSYIRVYDFFVLKDTLYAYFYLHSPVETACEIYRYDGDRFVYHSEMAKGLATSLNFYGRINGKAEFAGKQYFSNGQLYRSADMITAEAVNLGENVEVNDLRKIGDTLYLLCDERIEKEDGTEEFRVSMRASTDGEEFRELFYFNYPVRALSFTHANDTFYLGMGYGKNSKQVFYDENGMILSIEYPL